ncbi:hypothetical protein [Alteromonas sp. 14N.309.X.WAT.G.H12]|uniref:hypothetical protein n=1 Tax=Alteromonas sp. 14N.309.X.WAT.G.H12 TaxID=3120824 RepID=UPI002FD14C3A
MKNLRSAFGILILLFWGNVNAELLINGDFEDVTVSPEITETSESYESYTFEGWFEVTNEDMLGWSSANGITEVWYEFTGVEAQSGEQLIELNSISQNTLYQLFPTIAGNSYQFSIFYDSRFDLEEQFRVYMQDFDTSEFLFSVDVLDNDESDS